MALDRPRGRVLLVLLATILATWRNRQWCRVYYIQSFGWVTRFGNGECISDERPILRAPSSYFGALSGIFCHSYRPRSGDTVMDIGAGIGLETLMFSELVGEQGRVISVEGNRRVYSFLDLTIRGSHHSNIEWINAAVVSEAGVVLMTDDERHTHSHVSTDNADDAAFAVAGITVDDLFVASGMPSIAFLKMNIEGAELDALRGATRTLSAVDNVAISCHDFIADMGGAESFRTYDSVRQLLEQAGFSLVTRPHDRRAHVRCILYGSRRNSDRRLTTRESGRDRVDWRP
jgi:FkbM family methyltransferase